MIEIAVLSLLAALSGTSIVVQQVINADLRTSLNSAAWSGFVSYAGGLACMMLLILLMRAPVPTAAATRLPWWAWSGGLFGALYVGLAIVLVPRLGSAAFVALLVTGQLVTAVVLDHFGLMGLALRPLDLSRAAGVLLLIGGVLLIRR